MNIITSRSVVFEGKVEARDCGERQGAEKERGIAWGKGGGGEGWTRKNGRM